MANGVFFDFRTCGKRKEGWWWRSHEVFFGGGFDLRDQTFLHLRAMNDRGIFDRLCELEKSRAWPSRLSWMWTWFVERGHGQGARWRRGYQLEDVNPDLHGKTRQYFSEFLGRFEGAKYEEVRDGTTSRPWFFGNGVVTCTIIY
jgi:hypothetical protein